MSPTTSTRRWAAAAVAAALSVPLLAACGSNDGSSAAGAGAQTSDGATTLTWTMWSGGTAEKEAWQAAAEQVSVDEPDLTVTVQTTSFDDYFSKIGTQMASGSAPCIVSAQSLRLGALVDGLEPLDDLIAEQGVDTSGFVPAALENLVSDGKQYALPYDDGPIFILYNKDLFAAAGVAEPAPDWTWEDFTAASKALTTGGTYGFSAYPGDMTMFAQVLALTGKQPVTEDGTLQLTDPDIEKAVTEYAGLVHADQVSPELSGNDSTFPYNQFIAGRTAMVADGPWDLLNVQSQSDFALGATTIPAGPQGSRTLSAGSGFGISKTCPAKEAAFRAIVSLTGEKTLSDLAAAGRAFPSRPSAQQAWYDQAFSGAKEALDAASASAEPFRTTSDWAQVSTDLIQFGVPVFNGSADATDVLTRIQDQYGR